MRIISGKFRGKKISFTNSTITRPLRDYVKENVFNILTHGKKFKLNLENVNILDLYSGVGSFGIECLSRNVNKAVFVEKDPLAFSILKKNISSLKLSDKAKLFFVDIKDYLEQFREKYKFDLIFLDPPYNNTSYLDIIKLIKIKKIFNSTHRIVIHRENKYEEGLEKVIKIDLIKSYGRSKIIFGAF